MATEQLSVTVPKDLVERAQAVVAAGGARSLSGYLTGALAQRLDADEHLARSHALVDSIFGLAPDAAAEVAAARAVEVIDAQAAALAWVRDVTGTYPAPRPVADAIAKIAERLRLEDGNAAALLREAAAAALAAYRPATA